MKKYIIGFSLIGIGVYLLVNNYSFTGFIFSIGGLIPVLDETI